jgi:hypothetical protein
MLMGSGSFDSAGARVPVERRHGFGSAIERLILFPKR